MHGEHRGRERIPTNSGPPTDDESFHYKFTAPLGAWYLNCPWDPHLIKGRHNEGLIYFGVSTILPIISAEPALFVVYAVDLLSRWRALRGFRKTLEDDHD